MRVSLLLLILLLNAWPAFGDTVVTVWSTIRATPVRPDGLDVNVRGTARMSIDQLDTLDVGKRSRLDGFLLEHYTSTVACGGSGIIFDQCVSELTAMGEGQIQACATPPTSTYTRPCDYSWQSQAFGTIFGSVSPTGFASGFSGCRVPGCGCI